MLKSAGRTWLIILIVVALALLLFAKKATAPTTTPVTETTQTETGNTSLNGQYVPYSPEAVAAAMGKKKLLFFHASWCPTCRAANQDILNNADQLPEDLIIFKTDYDTETALKKKYNVTYQHTFVLIDDQGNEIKQWNGGSIAKILEQI